MAQDSQGAARGAPATGAGDLVSLIESRIDRRSFQDTTWEGTFFDYLDIVNKDPAVVREFVAALQDGRGVPYMAKMNPDLDAAIRAELQRQTMRDI